MHSHSEFTWEFAFIVSCTHKWMLKVHRSLPGCIPYYIPYCIPRFSVRIPSSRKSDRNAYNCIIAIIKIESVHYRRDLVFAMIDILLLSCMKNSLFNAHTPIFLCETIIYCPDKQTGESFNAIHSSWVYCWELNSEIHFLLCQEIISSNPYWWLNSWLNQFAGCVCLRVLQCA